MRVGFFQFCPKPRAIEENLNYILRVAEKVDVDLLVLPELALTGYLFASREELASYALKVPDCPVCLRLVNLCSEKNINIVIGIAEKSDSRVFNSALLFTANGSIHTYRKVHLFTDEKDLFDPGDAGFPVFQLGEIKLGMLVCFDYFFPEGARTLMLRGAQIICHPANLILNYAQTMTITRSQENRVFWILANRIGTESLGTQTLTFTGQSQIIAPNGEVIVRASRENEELRVADMNPALALDKSVTRRNDILLDRRPEYYL